MANAKKGSIPYGVHKLISSINHCINLFLTFASDFFTSKDNSLMEWSFKKAITVQTYSTYHPVPVPFNLISSIWLLCEKYISSGCIARCRGRDTDDENYLKARVCCLASGNVSPPKKATGMMDLFLLAKSISQVH